MFSLYLKHSLFRHYADFSGRASRMEYLSLFLCVSSSRRLSAGWFCFWEDCPGRRRS